MRVPIEYTSMERSMQGAYSNFYGMFWAIIGVDNGNLFWRF